MEKKTGRPGQGRAKLVSQGFGERALQGLLSLNDIGHGLKWTVGRGANLDLNHCHGRGRSVSSIWPLAYQIAYKYINYIYGKVIPMLVYSNTIRSIITLR